MKFENLVSRNLEYLLCNQEAGQEEEEEEGQILPNPNNPSLMTVGQPNSEAIQFIGPVVDLRYLWSDRLTSDQ